MKRNITLILRNLPRNILGPTQSQGYEIQSHSLMNNLLLPAIYEALLRNLISNTVRLIWRQLLVIFLVLQVVPQIDVPRDRKAEH